MEENTQKKAYHVFHHTFEEHEIYFAKSNIEARRWFADEHCDGELSGISCKRCHWADEYYPKSPPVKAYLDHGWSFECQNCNYHVWGNSDWHVFEGRNWVFCDKECQDDYHAKIHQLEAIANS
jgi:hypothetical protein